MKPLLFLATQGLGIGALVLATAACAPSGKPAARAGLDCPARQGDLSRVSQAADHKSCVYTTAAGDEVNLRLVPVTSGPQAALQPIEAELQAELSLPAPQTGGKAPEAPLDKGADAERIEREANADAANGRDRSGDGRRRRHGDHTRIDLPGIHISADDNKANVRVGAIHVDAGEDGAEVRMSRDVRLRGEALSPERRGFRSTYILARDDLRDGYKAVGYEAAGPKSGPLTVAVVKAKSGERNEIFDDVKRLVRKNGGV